MSYSDGVRNVVRAIGHGCVWICEETLRAKGVDTSDIRAAIAEDLVYEEKCPFHLAYALSNKGIRLLYEMEEEGKMSKVSETLMGYPVVFLGDSDVQVKEPLVLLPLSRYKTRTWRLRHLGGNKFEIDATPEEAALLLRLLREEYESNLPDLPDNN